MSNVEHRRKQVLTFVAVVALLGLAILILATAAQAGVWLPGQQRSDGVTIQRMQAVPSFHRATTGSVKVHVAPKPPPARSGDIWDCIFREESGNRPLACAPYCGRGQWLPSTWRAAGGTKYASLPQYATEAQEKEIARSWLARTDWGQWPNTSRECGAR